MIIYTLVKKSCESGWLSANQKTAMGELPACSIDFSNFGEVAKHDKLVALVNNMLELQKKYHDARMERGKELYERQIKMVDAQIDRLVYELYGLTEEDVKHALYVNRFYF